MFRFTSIYQTLSSKGTLTSQFADRKFPRFAPIALLALATFTSFTTSSTHASEIVEISNSGFHSAYLINNKEADHFDIRVLIHAANKPDEYVNGLRHYVEHLAWLYVKEAAPDDLEREFNAWTDSTITGYSVSMVSTDNDELTHSLDLFTRLFDTIDLEESVMLAEKEVLLREYDLRVKENPIYLVLEGIREALYPGDVRAFSVIGTPQEIGSITITDALSLHKESHNLASASLVITGNFDSGLVTSAVQDLFPVAESSEAISPNQRFFPASNLRDVQPQEIEDFNPPQLLVYNKIVSLKSTLPWQQLNLARNLLARILESGLAGSLDKPLVFDDFIARSLSLNLEAIDADHLHLQVAAVPDRGVSLEELHSAIENQLELLAAQAVNADSMESKRQQWLTRLKDTKRPELTERDLVATALKALQAADASNFEKYQEGITNLKTTDLQPLLDAFSNEGRVVSRLITRKAD